MLTGSAYSNATLYSCLVHTVVNPIGSTSFGVGLINSYQYNRTGTLVYSPYINELSTLDSDPCVDASSEDFNLNSSSTELRENKISP